MRFFVSLLIAVGLLSLPRPSLSMTLEVAEGTLFATGEVSESDLASFKTAISASDIRRVVFADSPGGDADTGIAIGRLIQARGYSTVVAGQCLSACSVMFIGGRERFFANTFHPAITLIGIHGAHEIDLYTNEVRLTWDSERATERMEAFFKEQMGTHYKERLMNKAFFGMGDEDALLVIPDSIREPKATVYFCRSGKTERKDCNEAPAEDALSMGLITSRKIQGVSLPAPIQKAIDEMTLTMPASTRARTGVELATREQLLECLRQDEKLKSVQKTYDEQLEATNSQKKWLAEESENMATDRKSLDIRDRAKVQAFNRRTDKYNQIVKKLNQQVEALNALAANNNQLAASYNKSCGSMVYAPEDYAAALAQFNRAHTQTH